jgi:hypothetical protein
MLLGLVLLGLMVVVHLGSFILGVIQSGVIGIPSNML